MSDPSSAADFGARYLAILLQQRAPFFFLRLGDGFLECVAGKSGATCDMELYTPALASSLLSAWERIRDFPSLILGDWQTASFTPETEHTRYQGQYEALLGNCRMPRIHFESLLLNRESPHLIHFYETVLNDPRRKLVVGPRWYRGAADILGARFLEVPFTCNLLHYADKIELILDNYNFDVLLYGAGMAGNIPVINTALRYPERTYVSLGSAFDPLFTNRTRTGQLERPALRRMFLQMLTRVNWDVAV